MNVLHVTPAFYPATYWGGPIFSVYSLCNALAKFPDVSLKVLTTDTAGPSRNDSVPVASFPMHYSEGYEVYFCHRWWAASIAPGMFLRLWPMIRWADVVHLTAVYSPPTIPTLLICRLLGKPVVWSPRGALQRWEGATKLLAKNTWELVCNMLIRSGRCFLHVTGEAEAVDSVERISKAIVKLIPNGVDIAETPQNRVWLPEGKLRLLYIGRLHPIKGIENLLRALKILAAESFTLEIYGSGDDAYSLSLSNLVHELGLDHCVSFRGHVDGEKKKNAFINADVCVVPSYTENFGMVVAEALAHGVPVIASKGTPWEKIERHDCGLWVENSPKSLANAISYMRKSDLQQMGFRGWLWMKKDFSWEKIAHQMKTTYVQLAGAAQ